ncbi:ABC transporter substrate-binding protein [Haloarchaeobius baliensis]|uniref:ABC transporter substrate-binding protein n=1 Tax=Haloarchaeobius baliensis TaxID=1670458 RepID=UPI003F881BCD
MPRDSDQAGFEDYLTRRSLLAATAATGLTTIAGCSSSSGDSPGDGEEDGTSTGGDDGIDVADATYTTAFNGDPTDMHFNSFANQNYTWHAGEGIFAPFMQYSFSTDEFVMGALSDVTVEDGTVTLAFRDDLTWSNGDDWTTDDLDVQLQLAEKTGNSLFGYIDGYEIVDEKTAELALTGDTNPQIIKFELTNYRVDVKKDTHEQFLDAEAAEFLQWAWEDPVASGPFKFDNKDRQAIELTRNEEFYNAENVNFETHILKAYGGNSAQHQALLTGRQVDAAISLFTPPETADQFADNVQEVRLPAKWGYGMVFNHDDEHFGQRAVRQAVAHVVDRQALVDNAGPRTKTPAPIPCGIASGDQETWLGDWYDQFEDYGVDSSQTDEAAAILEEAGFSRQNGTWTDSDGNPVEAEYLTPAGWTDWVTQTQTAVSQLNDFGFDITISTTPTNDLFGRYSESNFKLGAFYWLPGGARSAFPYFPLQYQLKGTDISDGHNYESKARSEQTIPGPDGGEMTLTPLETAEMIAQQSSNEDAMPHAKRAAWHNHIELPFLSLVTKFDQSWVTDDEWTTSSEGDATYGVKWPQHWWTHQGDLQYNG